MYIKAQTVIPAGTLVTKCPPSVGKGKSVYLLERAQERILENSAENNTKARQFTAALKVGFTAEEAMKLIGIGSRR